MMELRLIRSVLLVSFFTFVIFFSVQVEQSEAGTSSILLGCCSTVPGNAIPSPGSCLGCPDGIECAINEPDCVGSFLSGGSCAQMGSDFTCMDPGSAAGCCVIPSERRCQGGPSLQECQEDLGGTLWVAGVECEQLEECAEVPVITNVPTLNQWGLIALAGVLGIVGLVMVFRRKATA